MSVKPVNVLYGTESIYIKKTILKSIMKTIKFTERRIVTSFGKNNVCSIIFEAVWLLFSKNRTINLISQNLLHITQ